MRVCACFAEIALACAYGGICSNNEKNTILHLSDYKQLTKVAIFKSIID